MKPEIVRAFILIGVRALAEYDIAEVRRMTSMSKSQIDLRLKVLIKDIGNKEVIELYQALENTLSNISNQEQLRFLLNQLYHSAFQKAQYNSILYSKLENKNELIFNQNSINEKDQTTVLSSEKEYARLAVMKLLRSIPNYTPSFEDQWQEFRIDCVLKPNLKEGPVILIEVNSKLQIEMVKKTFSQMKQYMQGFGSKSIGIIITLGFFENDFESFSFIDKEVNLFFVNYDYQTDQIGGPGF